jgi:hypothetical protein
LQQRWPLLDRAFSLWLWPWFAFWSYFHLHNILPPLDTLLLDARIYRAGSAAWLAGSDPWLATYHGLHFAALPPVVPLLAPLAIVPDVVFGPLWLAICLVAAVLIVRRLRLGPVWLIFPPLVQGVTLGNPAIPAFALFIYGAQPIALLVRPHLVFVTLVERRWRAILLTAAIGAFSLLVAPWPTYMRDLPEITSRYATEGAGGANGPAPLLWLAVAATAAVLLFDRRRAGWLASTTVAVPVAYHGLVAVMPIRSRVLGAVASFPFPGVPAVVAVVALAQVVFRRLSAARASSLLESVDADASGAATVSGGTTARRA